MLSNIFVSVPALFISSIYRTLFKNQITIQAEAMTTKNSVKVSHSFDHF